MSPAKPHEQVFTKPGYHDLPSDMLAAVVTSLEMLARPDLKISQPRIDVRLQHWPTVDLEAYRSLYRLVGEDWLWCSRLLAADGQAGRYCWWAEWIRRT